MMYFADTTRGKNYAKDPAVVFFGGRYLMYYSVPPWGDGRPHDGWVIGVAESRDLDNWTKICDLPRLTALEENGFCAPGAIVLDGTVHLFYQTYGNGANEAICHAVSRDGIRFTPNETNPVFHPAGDWTCGRAIDADVIPFRGRLWLYVATRDPKMEIQKLAVASAPLDGAFRRDEWRQECSDSILQPELPWEQKCIEAPALCEHEGRLYLFYGGAYNNCPQQIGCAVSEDAVHWKRVSDSPVLPCGEPGSWNSSESGHPFVFTAPDGVQHLFYQGNSDHGRSWYLSRREIRWRGGVPVFE